MIYGLDSETTGLHRFHGCRPFLVVALPEEVIEIEDEKRISKLLKAGTFVADVNPLTREPGRLSNVDQLVALVNDPENTFAFHHAKFDVGMLSTIPSVKDISLIKRADDTAIRAHAVNNTFDLGLKKLAELLGNIPGDRDELRNAVDECRRIGIKLGWKIASAENCPYLAKAPKSEEGVEGWWALDMWLPRAVAKHMNYPKDHPYWNLCIDYCQMDVIRTLVLRKEAKARNEKVYGSQPVHIDLQRKANVVFYKMEKRGITVNKSAVTREIQRMGAIADTERVAAEKAGNEGLGNVYAPGSWAAWAAEQGKMPTINIGSPKQLTELIYNKLEQPVAQSKLTDTGNPSTSFDALSEILRGLEIKIERGLRLSAKDTLAKRFLDHYLLWTKYDTAVAYLKGYDRLEDPKVSKVNKDTGDTFSVIHPGYNCTGTDTFRASSSNPNLQNVSKGGKADERQTSKQVQSDVALRRVFGPAYGREWWDFDYSQLQLAIFAFASGEKAMQEAIRAGFDFHTFMAREIFKLRENQEPTILQRRLAKAVNFGFIFGSGPSKIDEVCEAAGVTGMFSTVSKLFPTAVRYIDRNKRRVSEFGYVETMGGYRLYVPRDRPYAATNYIVQGTEGEIVKKAMVDCDQYLVNNTPDTFITVNVHDELIFDFASGVGEHHYLDIATTMADAAMHFGVEADVGVDFIDTNWAEGKKVEIEWVSTD